LPLKLRRCGGRFLDGVPFRAARGGATVRRRAAVLLAACLAALAIARPGASQPPAPGDLPVYHRHNRTSEFPIDLAAIEDRVQKQQLTRPSELQLYYRNPN